MKKDNSNNPLPFTENFSSEIQVASPGRINLIGEHTDYNQGFVLPTAIDRKIYFKLRRNQTEDICKVYSSTFQKYVEFNLSDFAPSKSSWKNYIFGVIDEIQQRGKKLEGFDCIINSELPIGAGISSSAALECGLAAGLNALFNLGFTAMEIVKLCQGAENNFVGSNCGIMDQYASVMGRKDHLILLDCQSLKAEFIPADFKNCKILLLNTNVTHNLAEGEYNIRRSECEAVIRHVQMTYPEVSSLRDVNLAMLQEFKNELSPKIYQRSLYVLNENERVLQATIAIQSGDLVEFGKLMYQSHEGLQHHYEVSCAELDFLVDFSRPKDFIYGSRMMGGGFGGCTINIIEAYKIDAYVKEISGAYKDKFHTDLDAIIVVPSEGTEVS